MTDSRPVTANRRSPLARISATRLLPAMAMLVGSTPLSAQMENVEIATTRITDNVFMLAGRGGNIGLFIGDDGAFLIDDQYAPLTPRILAAIASVTDQPITFVVNTHWHGDHTGGNENFGTTGSIIVAHENVRTRMTSEQFIDAYDTRYPAAPADALPTITFTDEVRFYWNDDEIEVIHVQHAHTDGDAIIYLRRANVVHMGDTYFSRMYPFIDYSTGGTLTGTITALDRVFADVPNDAIVIPGHGELSDMAELREYRGMLVTVRERLMTLIADGKSKEEIIAAKPTADLDADWGGGFFQPDQWVGWILNEIMRR